MSHGYPSRVADNCEIKSEGSTKLCCHTLVKAKRALFTDNGELSNNICNQKGCVLSEGNGVGADESTVTGETEKTANDRKQNKGEQQNGDFLQHNQICETSDKDLNKDDNKALILQHESSLACEEVLDGKQGESPVVMNKMHGPKIRDEAVSNNGIFLYALSLCFHP